MNQPGHSICMRVSQRLFVCGAWECSPSCSAWFPTLIKDSLICNGTHKARSVSEGVDFHRSGAKIEPKGGEIAGESVVIGSGKEMGERWESDAALFTEGQWR